MHLSNSRSLAIRDQCRVAGLLSRAELRVAVRSRVPFKRRDLPVLWFASFFFSVILPLVAPAASPLETWRGEAARIRQLAENDSPLAYEQALQLQTAIPATATPADATRALNLLARIEIHLALTDQAAKHAQLALEAARKSGDRIGQAEAQLNICLTSVNQGDIEQLIAAASESISLLDGIDRPDLLGEALLRTSMMYRRTGRIEESVTMCMQAMEIARHTHNSLALTVANQAQAISYHQSESRQQALEH